MADARKHCEQQIAALNEELRTQRERAATLETAMSEVEEAAHIRIADVVTATEKELSR